MTRTDEVFWFRADWPAIQDDDSPEGIAVQQLAALYVIHPDPPTYGLLMGAYDEWRQAKRKAGTETSTNPFSELCNI